MSQLTDKLNDYPQAQRDLIAKFYQHGREDAFEEAAAAARDQTLCIGVACGFIGLLAGLSLGGLL